MRLLLIINYKHKASKQLVKFLKLKKISFDYIDSSKKKKIKISKNYDYLISFLNSMYINKSVRKKIKINSFNFHPGPPEYPGFGCYNFALLDKVNLYGSTIHIINNKFDSGKIVNVKKFKFSYKKFNLEKLISKTHENIIKQAKDFINDIQNNKLKIEVNLKWKKKAYTKKEFETARKINLKDSKKNILKKIKAFSYKNYESVYLNFKGLKFELKKN
jgi:methionyl-tRNA formyltransferase